ncbi:nucleoside triphosphate pyrophosphatase [Alteromonas macleodii]|uniref:Maf family protein n=1 Tax=Alteromonas macleodii TaxID=28108 RepID=UPI0030CD740B
MASLVLASSSQYRKMLLANIGIQVDTHAPDIDETPFANESPTALSLRLAEQKAHKVAAELEKVNNDTIIIGSDQVALVQTDAGPQLLGKPGTFENAVKQLMACQGKQVSFYTALCLHQPSANKTITKVDETRVFFRHNSEAAIRAYVDKEQPLDCAGSFKSEGLGVLLFDKIESRDPNSLIGLPIMLLNELLGAHFDVDLLAMAAQ